MNRRWVIPAVLLALLVLALTFRWDTEASKTTDTAAVKWVRDRWTGRLWARTYLIGRDGIKAGEVLISKGIFPLPNGMLLPDQSPWPVSKYAKMERWIVSGAWATLTGACLVWLTLSLKPTKEPRAVPEHPAASGDG